jgi:HlyD family secretion protein
LARPSQSHPQNPNNAPIHMDRTIKKRTWTPKRIALAGGSALVLALLVYVALGDTRSKLSVATDKILVSEVQHGDFQEYIVVNGSLEPMHTVFVDAREGGVIKSVVQRSGAIVKANEVLLTLSNSSLELDVLNRESQLYEQLNNLRQTRLLVEQNELSLQNQLAEIQYQLQLLKPQYERNKKLVESGAVSKQDWEAIRENYDYNLRRFKLVSRQYVSDSAYRSIQIKQLDLSEERMTRSLEAVGEILDNLTVRAPISGQYSAPDLQMGQTVTAGFRLGQLDVLDQFKARVSIDELYLPRVAVGQSGSFDYDGKTYKLRVVRIYPTVVGGRFDVDMDFSEPAPKAARRGQTIRVRLEMSNPGQALLLPVGGFYQSTGGNWVFVVNASRNRAVKRTIRLGRKNAEYYEVLEGLQPGDRVVTSSYENYGTNEVLVLN